MYTHNQIECRTCQNSVVGWTTDLIQLDKLYSLACPKCGSRNEFYPKCDFPGYGIKNGAVEMRRNERQFEAFGRFMSLFPHGKERELVILKGHLLIEEQIRLIIDSKLSNPKVLKEARLTFDQTICLAQSLIPEDSDKTYWKAAKKLNNIRNKIAHKVEQKGLIHQIEDFVKMVPTDWGNVDVNEAFELALWSLFAKISSYVEGELSDTMKILIPDVETI